jgi:internalin A
MRDFRYTPEGAFKRAEQQIERAQLEGSSRLILSELGLVSVPSSIGNLTRLSELWLNSNQLTSLPKEMRRLARLETLRLSNNELSSVPEFLGNLTSLRTLSLRNNRLTSLPNSLKKLKNLTVLFLHENPGLDLPTEILGKSPDDLGDEHYRPAKEILDYYFANREGSRPLNEAKLILVGKGSVGKTSLVKKLVTGKFNSREKTTEGIRISDWECALGKSKAVRVHIWDFGGQEMQHATHQFFLTERALYLLVLNRRHDGYDEEADYWMRLIRAFGGADAPVIVVLNKQKKEPFDVNRGGWLEKYKSNIRGFVETDCTDARSIAGLTRAIQEQLREMRSVHDQFPTKWFAIKDELSSMSNDFVTSTQYLQICKKRGEAEPEKQKQLSRFLHDLGIALSYEQDDRLRFAYVLKPEWVTGGIYALLHGFVGSKGVFALAEAERVLAKKGYEREAACFLVELMERFELCFALNEDRTRFLIPQALADSQPEEAATFSPEKTLRFAYRYEIVPDGLLPQFVVRTEHMSNDARRWKSGAILEDSRTGCRALVRADKPERLVRIAVDGPEEHRQELLRIVRFNFDAIHANYKFTPVELVYPPEPEAKPMELGELRDRIEAGERKISVHLGKGKLTEHETSALDVKDPKRPLRTFLSYAHGDQQRYVAEMRKRLKHMERLGLLKVWSDHAIQAGVLWEETILRELANAELVICQLSSDFLASDFCMLTELQMAMEKAGRNEAVLVAYVLHECQWKRETALARFQLLPNGAKPISKWGSQHAYWDEIVDGIWKVAEPLQNELAKVDERRRMRHD